ncbi:MAG: DNA polymerase III subunit delta [Firmicutes bacterium]|nr:DNA polymerase III subunit delta [Bacillota bacterium]
MHYVQARRKIKQGVIYPFYLFSGPEKYLQEKARQEILLGLQQKGKDFSLEKLEGDRYNLPDLLAEVRQTTIFSGGRLLWVEETPYFSAKKKAAGSGKKKKTEGRRGQRAGEEELLAFLQREEVSDLILIFTALKVDRRKKLVKIIEERGRLVEFPLLRGAALKRWVEEELSLAEKQIEGAALDEFLARGGEDLRALQRELEKIVTYLGEEKTVTHRLVTYLVPESSEGNIFRLVGAVGRQDVEEALLHLHKLFQQNEPPLVILAMIARQYRLLYQYLTLKAGKTQREAAATMKLPPFILRELAGQAQNYTPSLLARIIARIKEIDLGIKTGRYGANEALERLVLQLTSSAGNFIAGDTMFSPF